MSLDDATTLRARLAELEARVAEYAMRVAVLERRNADLQAELAALLVHPMFAPEREHVRGWKCIAAAINRSIDAAKRYALRADRTLPVFIDDNDGTPVATKLAIMQWRADSLPSYREWKARASQGAKLPRRANRSSAGECARVTDDETADEVA